MRIRIGYDIELSVQAPTAVVFLLQVHPDRASDLLGPDEPQLSPPLLRDHYLDVFGNRCMRVKVPAGIDRIAVHHRNWIHDSGLAELWPTEGGACAVEHLPPATLVYLLPSRYCEVDHPDLMALAWQRFGALPPGWPQVRAVCDFVHQHLHFDYQRANAHRTARDAWREGVGVCRDFTHLALTLCRCLNIPARYATGYLGDIGVPLAPYPMDFSAWFEVWLDGAWHSVDARHNQPRIGRIVIARGRDAADVPISMVFGQHTLQHFCVITDTEPA